MRNICLATCSLLHQSRSHMIYQIYSTYFTWQLYSSDNTLPSPQTWVIWKKDIVLTTLYSILSFLLYITHDGGERQFFRASMPLTTTCHGFSKCIVVFQFANFDLIHVINVNVHNFVVISRHSILLASLAWHFFSKQKMHVTSHKAFASNRLFCVSGHAWPCGSLVMKLILVTKLWSYGLFINTFINRTHGNISSLTANSPTHSITTCTEYPIGSNALWKVQGIFS